MLSREASAQLAANRPRLGVLLSHVAAAKEPGPPTVAEVRGGRRVHQRGHLLEGRQPWWKTNDHPHGLSWGFPRVFHQRASQNPKNNNHVTVSLKVYESTSTIKRKVDVCQVVGRVEDLDKHEVPESFKRPALSPTWILKWFLASIEASTTSRCCSPAAQRPFGRVKLSIFR